MRLLQSNESLQGKRSISLRTIAVLLALVFTVTIGTAMADDIKAMLRKLKSSDRMEMRTPTSVAAARGMSRRENLRSDASTESMRSSIRESIQAMAADEIKSAEFEFGKVCKDIHGNWVRIEEYIKIAPEDANGIAQLNKFKVMILNEREDGDRLDYFQNISTFENDLPTDPAEFSSLAKDMYKSASMPENQLLEIYNIVSNTQDEVVWTATGGTSVPDSENPGGYETIFEDYVYTINDVTQYKYHRPDLSSDVDNRSWTVGDDVVIGLDKDGLKEEIKLTDTIDSNGGYLVTAKIGDETSTETYYYIDDEGNSLMDSSGAFPGGVPSTYNYEMIFTNTAFEGGTIDIVVAPEIFIASGIPYL